MMSLGVKMIYEHYQMVEGPLDNFITANCCQDDGIIFLIFIRSTINSFF